MRNKYLQLYFILSFLFLLGNYKGYISLWTTDSPLPCHVSQYPVAMLPQADQDEINRGLWIRSEVELRKAIEDFLS